MSGKRIRVRRPALLNQIVTLATALTAVAFTCQGSGGQSDYEVLRRFPHDTTAYTQGLLYADGRLYESTGQLGRSQVRKVDLETGRVLVATSLPNDRFGEGLALLEDKLYQLTWQTNVGYVYEAETLVLVDSFAYEGEGWGLATDGTSLIMSDGTASLKFLDPETFEVIQELTVQDQGSSLTSMVRIDPATGEVQAWFNLRGLLPSEERSRNTDVLNGIAYNEATDNLLVTGKFWPALFEIRLRDDAEGSEGAQ
jgi:glutamine cyclotransferase